MAFLAARIYSGYGARSDVLGDTKSPNMIVKIKARGDKAELITSVDLSYSDWGLAAIAAQGCFGRVQILRGERENPDVYADPLEFIPSSIAELDQSIRTQDVFHLVTSMDPIEIPPGITYSIVVSAAYKAGDAAGVPTLTLARLTVRGHTKGSRLKLEEDYTTGRKAQ